MIEQRTIYPDVEFTCSISANKVIFALERLLSSCGTPNKLISGNGLKKRKFPFDRTNSRSIFQLKVLKNITEQALYGP